MSIKLDIIDGAGLQWDSSGVSISRIAKVDVLDGSPSSIVWQAVNVSEMPQRGEQHPDIPGVFVDSLNAVATGAGQVTVTINYKPLDVADRPPDDSALPEIDIGATSQQVTTEKDADGNVMEVIGLIENEQTGGLDEDPVPVEVEIAVPMVVFNFKRKESAAPYDKARLFVGTVNAGPFFGDGPRIWLCTNITGNSSDGGQSYMVSYEFQRKPETWDATVAYVDARTGKIQKQSLKTYQVYPTANFNNLGLS